MRLLRSPVHGLLLLLLGLVAGLLVRRPPGPAAEASPPPSFVEIVRRSDPAVAHVTIQLAGERVPRSRDDAVGAGFVYRSDGLVVTSRHLLQGAQRVHVSLQGHGTFEARVLGQDDATDVALLSVPVQGLAPLAVGDPHALAVGEWVLAAGSPYHLAHSWSAGIVSGLGRSQVGVNLEGFEDFIQTDAAANVGNSGGPLLNGAGQVVGMVTAILSRAGQHGITLATPIDVVLEAARQLAESGRVVRPSLGMVLRERDVRASGAGGLEVTRFQPGSAAREAGLLPGDVVLAVEGRPIRRVADLQRTLWSRPPGQPVRLRFEREGRIRELEVRPR